jgi:predicted O-methyltransferase YrrM
LALGWDQADRDALVVLRPLLENSPYQGGKSRFAPKGAHGTTRGYLPWTEGALRPAALAAVCNEIAFADRRELVELGSGISTVALARLARERGARLTSVEHQPDWAQVVRSQLEREDLADVASLVEAPLEPHPLALDGAPWYADAALSELPADGIDLLLVDGPPGYGDGMERSRYPALPALEERLSPTAMIVLDDAGRAGEQDVLARWQAEGAGRFSARDEGIAVGVRA